MGAACDESDENTFAIMKKNCTNVNVEVIRFRLIVVGQLSVKKNGTCRAEF